MTTEMKQLLALLLLGCVFADQGAKKGAKKDPCTNGMAAVELFMEYPGCEDPNPYRTLGTLLRTVSSNRTVHNFNNVFTNFCSTLFPRIKECFERNIQNCSDDDRNSLMRVVQETGFVCEPNTNNTNPVINHLLDKLTDLDLAQNESCGKQDLSMVRLRCYNRSLEAIGANVANITDVIEDLSMQQLAPKFQTVTRRMIECMVNNIHDRFSGCPQWRGKAIWGIRVFILPPILGKSMPFTTAELDRLFRWQSGAQAQEDLEQSLLNLFK